MMLLHLILISYFNIGLLVAITAAIAANNDVWEQYSIIGFFSIVLVWLPVFLFAAMDLHYKHKS